MERKKETLFYNNKKIYNTIMIASDILSFLSLIFLIIFIIIKIIHFQDAGKTLITLFFSSLPFLSFFVLVLTYI